MKKRHARQLTLKIIHAWPKKNSYKEFDDEKKFLLLENSPPSPPITFLMARPLVTVERKHTGHLNFFNGTNQIYHADEKKKNIAY